MPRDSAAADRPASYLVGTAAAFPLFFRDRTKPINQLPFSPSAKFPKSGSSCESRANEDALTRNAAKPKKTESRADEIVKETRRTVRRIPGTEVFRRILEVADDAVDDLEEPAFLAGLL